MPSLGNLKVLSVRFRQNQKKVSSHRFSLPPCFGLKSSVVLDVTFKASCHTDNNPTTLGDSGPNKLPSAPCHCALWLCHQHWDASANSRLLFSSLGPSQVHIPQTWQKPHFLMFQMSCRRVTLRIARFLHSSPSWEPSPIWKPNSPPQRNQDDGRHQSCRRTSFV